MLNSKMNLAIFSHGKESSPNSTKINMLRQVAEKYGFTTAALDYTRCLNANERIQLLRAFVATQNTESLVLVGSSMGGYISTVLATDYQAAGLFLLCPALYMPDGEYEVQEYHPLCKSIEIIHGWEDEVVPYENSIRFGHQTKAVVNLVADNHRLQNSYAFIEKRFTNFLETLNVHT
jgi:pimeloyl-ACP methyl ester carboxylesterase